jgi:peptidoglycan/LPS O-acetylase OafA/YrhL
LSVGSQAQVRHGARIAPLDGVRALAIGLVVAFHTGVPGFGGGGIGVTLFFVLSGYLITGVLLRPGALRGAGLKRFYLRRALRLFPALAVLVAWGLIYALVVLDGEERARLLTSCLTSITYTQDLYLGRGAENPDFGFLGHTWSLAVEEQFYLVWPFALLLLMTRLATARARLVLVVGATLVFTAWRAYLSWKGLGAHVGLNVDAKGDALLVGCALALALPLWRDAIVERRQRLLTAAAVAGVAAIALVSVQAVPPALVPLGTKQLLVSLATAAVIARLVLPAPTGMAALGVRTFSLRPVVWIGLVSYSLYLWHVPVIEVYKDAFGITTTAERALFGPLILATALLMAAASYYLVERPFLLIKERHTEQAAAARGEVELAAAPAPGAQAQAHYG